VNFQESVRIPYAQEFYRYLQTVKLVVRGCCAVLYCSAIHSACRRPVAISYISVRIVAFHCAGIEYFYVVAQVG
jgi:hypothetical protein